MQARASTCEECRENTVFRKGRDSKNGNYRFCAAVCLGNGPAQLKFCARRVERAQGGETVGENVVVRSNGTAVHMRARVNRQLVDGAVRAPEEHVRALDQAVEVSKQ